MPFTLKMPKLSPTMEEGTLVAWQKKEGDFVEAGAVLLEVATDKATVEYEAIDEGFLRKILVKGGDEALVNEALAVFTLDKEESIEGYVPEGLIPVEVVAKEEEPSETSSTSVTRQPVAAGGLAMPAFEPEPPLELQNSGPSYSGGRSFVSPLAKKWAEDKGLDLTTVKGSGPRGRIMSRDLDMAQPGATVGFGTESEPTDPPGTYEEENLTPMRKIVGKRLQEAKTFIPHFYVTQVFDAQPVANAREELKGYGVKLTFNDFIVRACALALRKHPSINSGFNSVNQTIVRFRTIDIGIAVSVDGGLYTPLVRHADHKNLGEISSEVRLLAKRARENKLEPHEYKGGSFTISNLGMFGISDFIAVINPPQAAILAVGGIRDVPVVKNGEIVPGKTMSVTLSSDHRVIDGAAAADFLRTLKGYLENPSGLLV
jgi:pyruvate dehydrogenase E2 component (dihydrolipoamide acetyltransferase)